MGSVAMYLQGPGQERRPVKLLSMQPRQVRTDRVAGIRVAHGSVPDMEIRTLIDDEGRIASQVDFDGFKFKYRDSEIPWNLVFG